MTLWLNIIGFIVSLLIMASQVTVAIAPHYGWNINGIRSGSMVPVLQRGSLVVTQPVDPNVIKINDIIAFLPVENGETTVCHRVIAIDTNWGLEFTTKGDALPRKDPYPVPADNVVGKIVYSMPVLGFFAIFLHTTVGFFMSLVLPGLLIFYICITALRSEMKKKD